MTKENHIKEELLKQTDMSDKIDKESIRKILARDAKRLGLLKSITLISWCMTVICFITFIVFRCIYGTPNKPGYVYMAVLQIIAPVAAITTQALLIISIFLTISFYIRSKNLSIKQINNRLANIEEQLKDVLAFLPREQK